jgi:hypothetical protein
MFPRMDNVTAMCRINVAVRLWWRRLNRRRGTLCQRLTNNAGNIQCTLMRAQASWLVPTIHIDGRQRTSEQVSTKLTFTAADHRRLSDAHHQWDESSMRRGCKRSRGGRLSFKTGHSAGATRLYDLERQNDARAIAQRVPNTRPSTLLAGGHGCARFTRSLRLMLTDLAS